MNSGDCDRMMPDGRHLTSVGSFTMVMTLVRVTLVTVGTAAYVGLAILGWGRWTAFFSHPALVALAVALSFRRHWAHLAPGACVARLFGPKTSA
jgi:hypothetical protein